VVGALFVLMVSLLCAVKMMEFSKWICSDFDEAQQCMTSPDKRLQIVVLVRHEFLSQLSRMSVVVRLPDSRHLILAKGFLPLFDFILILFHFFFSSRAGAPEEIARHCEANSLPKNFAEILSSYTAKGEFLFTFFFFHFFCFFFFLSLLL
jgi:magnesium-transporting ATPase (P-type)